MNKSITWKELESLLIKSANKVFKEDQKKGNCLCRKIKGGQIVCSKHAPTKKATSSEIAN